MSSKVRQSFGVIKQPSKGYPAKFLFDLPEDKHVASPVEALLRCLQELAQKERIRRHLNLSNAQHRRLRERNTIDTQQHVGFYRRRTAFVPEVEATQFIDQCANAPSWRRARSHPGPNSMLRSHQTKPTTQFFFPWINQL